MTPNIRAWLAIVDGDLMRRVSRSGWRELPLADGAARPSPHDVVDLLVTRGPHFVTEARFAGSALVVKDRGDVVVIRHRYVAPTAHEPELAALGTLHVAASWTHERLGGLIGGLVPLEDRDHERIEFALRDAALALGPAASRPAHHRPRTPGRRALGKGRAAWRPVIPPRASGR